MNPSENESPLGLMLKATKMIPAYQYLLGVLLISFVFLYNFLEMHFFEDLFTGFRGQQVTLTFNPSSQLYHDVVSKCRIFHGRYLATPWLCSPHLQTVFVHFFGYCPVVKYRRQLFVASDSGTIALDWAINAKAQGKDRNPIMIIIPGLTSSSNSAYIKHLVSKMAHHWNVVVQNHRGFGGVPMTSDFFYNGGYTEDLREVIDHLHCQYPETPLFLLGTSIGANIMVKYLGEDGISVPVAGAAAICCPWDLLICDRFISRRLIQRFYNKALTVGLKKYACLHKPVLSRLSNWETVQKSRFVRDFDDSTTRILGNFETVDTFYRCSSSSLFVGKVMVPLLCISSLDDPVCSSEAIPWDECRSNSNVVLITTQHGGHLPFFEGLTANSVWWMRAVDQFFKALQSSPLSNRRNEVQKSISHVNLQESSIDHSPYIHISEDGMLTGVSNQEAEILAQQETEESLYDDGYFKEKPCAKVELSDITCSPDMTEEIGPITKFVNQISCQNPKTFWLLANIAIMTSWPLVDSALAFFFRFKEAQNFSSEASHTM